MHNNPAQEETTTQEKQEKRTPILSKNPDKAMQQMMETIDQMRSQMLAETEALKETNTKEFMRLQDDKITVSRKYMHAYEELMARKEEMKTAKPSLKKKLEEMRKDFAVITKENLTAIDKMSKGMRSLENRIMETARKEAQKEKQFAYGASGQLSNGLKSTIGINESA